MTAPLLAQFDSTEAMLEGARAKCVEILNDAIAKRGKASIALSGGSTPKPLYEMLARSKLDTEKIFFFWGDERCVPPTDKESNYKLANDAWLSKVKAPHVFRMQGEAKDLDEAAKQYEKQIRETIDRFDLNLLGIGDDGHTASLFPGTKALHEEKRWVVPNIHPQDGKMRLTFTFPLINASRNVMFVVAGSEKAEAMARVANPNKNIEQTPAQGVKAETVLWFCDDAAAKKVPGDLS